MRHVNSLGLVYLFILIIWMSPCHVLGWSGGAMVLGKLTVPGRPTIWITVGQGDVGWCDGAG